jgi:hypothetical protein
MKKAAISTPAIFAAFVLAACGGDEPEFVASCSDPEMSDGSKICLDAVGETADFVRSMCRVGRGEWRVGQLCDTAGALGGCRQRNGSVMWFFPSRRAESLDDVIESCDGEVLTVGNRP